jgi:hypothetical protein
MMLLIDEDNEPAKSIYFLGSKVIRALVESHFGVIDTNFLFRALNEDIADSGSKVSYDYFLLTLDWLFLLEKIDLNDKGDVVRCF